MKTYRRVYIDTETTGTDIKLHHVHQISGIITDHQFNVLEKFDIKFRPISTANASPEAMEKCRLTPQILEEREMTAAQAHAELCEILGRHCNKYDKTDKMHLVGYRAGFDADFLRAFFAACGDNYFGSWFWNPPIDLLSVAGWLLGDGRGALPNFKLETVCQAAELGWDATQAHDAMYDIEKTLELDRYLKSNFSA